VDGLDISDNRTGAGEAHSPILKFEAPPSTHTGRIRYLDGWRGCSILLVLAGHSFRSEPIAYLGVQMFFALSGRLMADILFVERFPLTTFYQRRISRIYPGLLAFVLLAYFLVRGTAISFKPLAAALGLTFLLNYGIAFGHGVPAIENLWSLCIEEHSYLLLGALAFLLRSTTATRPAPILFAIALLSIVDGLYCAFFLHQTGPALYWRTDTQLAPIFLAAAAYLLLRARQVSNWVAPICFCGATSAQFFAPLLGYSAGTMLLALAVASIDEAPRPLLKVLSWAPLVMFGMWSYSIYLWQQPFYRFSFLHESNRWPALLLGIGAGLASFYFIEQPARRWLNNNWRSTGRPQIQYPESVSG
jgi:peptidoglycan/LPS O-acetylase OafA/YrhL